MYGQPNYYTSPAMQTAQQRLQMMEAQYPQFASNPNMGYPNPSTYTPQTQQTAPAAPILKGRPVSNEEEANAAMIDFDGSLFVFPDKAHHKIYTKQLGLDGNIIFMKYSLDSGSIPEPAPVPVAPSIDLSDYVKKGDLNEQLSQLESQLGLLEQKINSHNDTTSKGGSKK